MVFNYLNWLEIAHDVQFIASSYVLLLFTDFICQPSFRYQIADVHFYSVIIYFSVVFLFILYIVFLKIRRYYINCRHKEDTLDL